MDKEKHNINNYRIKKIKEYIIFSYVISLLILGLMFKDYFFYTYRHIFSFNIFMVLIFMLIILGITRYLKKIKIFTIPSWKEYIKFFLLVSCFTFLIYINHNVHTSFMKIYYLIPIIISTVNYGRTMGIFVAAYASINTLLLSYISQNYQHFDTDILIIILFFWMVWLIGGLIDLERKIQVYLKNLIDKEKTLKKEKESNLQKVKELAAELNEVNKRLKESQKLFKLNFEESNIGMAICDINCNYIKTNSSLSNIIGYSKKEFKKINCKEIVHEEQQSKYKKEHKQMVYGKKSTNVMELKLLNKNDDIVWIRENITLARDDDGKPLYFLKQVEDITEKKQAEKQIKRQKERLEYNKIKRKFFAKVSHELKTPLNLIFTSLHMLFNNNDKQDEKTKKFLNIIKQNSYRLLKLVNNVIDLTKMDLNNFKLKKINIDIVLTIKKITDSTREYVKNNNRILIFNSDIKEQVIACDPFNIERIMLNLISNAVKFTEPGDKIFVNISKKNKNILISVQDTGIGLKKNSMKIIFDQFRQVDESFTKKKEGSGIGLSIVKSLVELHDGNIWVESKYGKGSVFYIELPIKIIDREKNVINKKKINADLINKVDVEFSDIYN